MRLAAHQPNYLPDLQFIHKMICSDKFVLTDSLQYSTQGEINRTQIKTAQGAQWLSVPVLTRRKGEQQIKDVRIDNSQNWRRKHRKSIYVNYRYAPYFEYYADFFEAIYRREWEFLVDLNVEIIQLLRKLLHIDCHLELSSALGFNLNDAEGLIDMMQMMDCDKYLADQVGEEKFVQSTAIADRGIQISYHDFQPPRYRQQFGAFIPDLSIIDLLFNEGIEARRVLLF